MAARRLAPVLARERFSSRSRPGAAEGPEIGLDGNTDGRRGSATYWRDRAAATEKPSRGRDQGRKVSPKRDQSGKPAKRDRRRREAGLFTL